jgi:hypothetical protein
MTGLTNSPLPPGRNCRPFPDQLASRSADDGSAKSWLGQAKRLEARREGDVAPDRYEQPKGFSLSLQMKSTTDAKRIFDALAASGRVVLPLEKTFWAALFGMAVDRFGIPWLINCEGAEEPADG